MEIVDYRRLRPGNLNSEEFRHLWLLLYWVFFGIFWALVERGGITSGFTPMYCPLDDRIPFCEYFLIPYLFWFVYLFGVHVYTLLFDTKAFRRLMYFIMITYSITVVIYLLFPTCQELRPASFERDNLFTRIVAGFYAFDTNTNVCPSVHVIGSAAAMFGFCDSKYMKSFRWKAVNVIITVLISASTVFLKQHSILDVLAAVPVCGVGYYLVYCRQPSAERAGSGVSIQRRRTNV